MQVRKVSKYDWLTILIVHACVLRTFVQFPDGLCVDSLCLIASAASRFANQERTFGWRFPRDVTRSTPNSGDHRPSSIARFTIALVRRPCAAKSKGRAESIAYPFFAFLFPSLSLRLLLIEHIAQVPCQIFTTL
jgi:hypothetical protein